MAEPGGGGLVELVGVYHAEGTVLGELKYAVGKLFGIAHCSLCDITHTAKGEKPGFASCRCAQCPRTPPHHRSSSPCSKALPLPFRTVHLNDQPAGLPQASAA